MRQREVVIPSQVLDIPEPRKRARAIQELAKRAKLDLTQPHSKEFDTSKRRVIVRQDDVGTS